MHQTANELRKPCTVHPSFRTKFIREAPTIGWLGFWPGNMKSLVLIWSIAARSAIAASDSGTRWILPDFIRSALTVQILASRSISDQGASRTSRERAAVKMRKASARVETELLSA